MKKHEWIRQKNRKRHWKRRTHKCSKKKRGSPHIGRGLCHGHDGIRPTVKARLEWRCRLRKEEVEDAD